METVFTSKLKSFFDAVAEEFQLYFPEKSGDHYTYSVYDPSGKTAAEFNDIRTCMPIKEFLFPMRELAATYPNKLELEDIKPFAVFGLKECDLRSIEILDKVFAEEDFEDPFYTKRRVNMFIISADCTDPGDTCFCNVFKGQGFAEKGFDLNVSKVKDGFIIESGSQKGEGFLAKHSNLFGDIPDDLLSERDANRAAVKTQLDDNNRNLKFKTSLKQIVEAGQESDVFDNEAKNCIECQACTRICPTCHCFDINDVLTGNKACRERSWDFCQHSYYSIHASGHNPRPEKKHRQRNRIYHKFLYSGKNLDLLGCVGCGRCITRCPVNIDIIEVVEGIKEDAGQGGDGA